MNKTNTKLFAKLAHGFANDPKIVGLSNDAFRAYIEALLYSCQHMTDGFLDERILKRYGWTEAATELTTNDVEPSWLPVDGGFMIHSFCEWQMTTAAHQKKVEAGRAGGLAKAESKRLASKALAGATNVIEQNASKVLLDKEEDKEEDKDLGAKRTRLKPDWKPSARLLQLAQEKYPLVDLTYQSERFINYWISTGKPMLDWERTWQNWMLKNQKELADQAAKPSLHHPPEDDWMYVDVKWGATDGK